ncbi:MAG TPA: metallophosphoesterase [Niabella sp.]|nr:metallophosphoesterase [Niabella sp.]HOZ97690.1 metallophosphoesterase [Niabella sp.]HQW13996.1 metallophosphoesterase [Niabella sp.]HQX19461.1 metallophosphoesterase [Niabella sp.]HQX40186.1 metallophosphoesterase [Niabella sp.]
MRNGSVLWIALLIILLIDLYVFFATRSLISISSNRNRLLYTFIYWAVSLLALATTLSLPYLQFSEQHSLLKSTLIALIFALCLGKIIAALFFFVDDIRRGVQWLAGRAFSTNNEISEVSGATENAITRSSFLSWLGVIAGGGLFSTFIYGLTNKYNYQIKQMKLSFENLPASFKGLKIIQISDIHSGSFTNYKAVNKGVDMILNQKPDIILFTGDLVNNKSDEVGEYQKIFSRLKAPMGVYSTLGNHDYGDYDRWPSPEAKAKNLEKLKSIHTDMGWRLMLDEHLPLEKNGETIGLIGVQNISGRGRFHSYGDLSKAMQGAEHYPFKILMSHDPSHWDMEVNKEYQDIDLTLSGHTHGMQFGVEIPGFRWSPVEYVYKQWAGLYEQGKQKLYVNRGYGFIGYPGRVGMLPEITVFELS